MIQTERRLSWPIIIMIAAGLIVGFLVIYPIGALLWGSFRTAPPGNPANFTIGNYIKAFTSRNILKILKNTFIIMSGVTLIASPIGIFLAWITTRTNTPFREQLEVLNVLPFLLSPFVAAIAWMMLLDKRMGIINHALVKFVPFIKKPPFDIATLGGTIFVLSLYYIPYMYLFVLGSFKAMDPSLEEAARISGSNNFKCAVRITLPLALPAILSGILTIFVHTAGQFGVPATLMAPRGEFVLTTQIQRFLAFYPQDYNSAATFGALLLGITATGVFIQRRMIAKKEFTTVTGKAYRPRLIDLGKWRYVTFAFNLIYLFVGLVMPYFALILVSFHKYWAGIINFRLLTLEHFKYVLFEQEASVRSIINSLFLATVGVFICLLLAMLTSYLINRTKVKGRGVFDYLSMLPIAIPGMVIGVGLLWAWIRVPIAIYGTIWIIMIAFITRYIPYGVRSLSSSLLSLGKEHEESSWVCGASWFRTVRRILIPLLKPGFAAAALLLYILFMRELSTAILLWFPGTEVVSVQIFQLLRDGDFPATAALATVQTILIFIGIIILRLITKEQFVARIR